MRGCVQLHMFRCSAVRAYIVRFLERRQFLSLSFKAAVTSMQYSVCLLLTRRCWDMSRPCGSLSQVFKLHTLVVRQVSLHTMACVLQASRLFMTIEVSLGTQVRCLIIISVGDSLAPSVAL